MFLSFNYCVALSIYLLLFIYSFFYSLLYQVPYNINAPIRIFQHFFLPEVDNIPVLRSQILIVPNISCDIFLDFGYPVLPIAL